jgi:SAM-dependent methyltransferase
MSETEEFGLSYASAQLARSRHPVRRVVKGFYLREVLRDVRGPTLDFGCGAGQLLRRLPPGSAGIEINPHLIEALSREGLEVIAYDASADDFAFTTIPVGRFETLVMSHVLEHFDNADQILKKLLRSCARIGIRRVVLVLPGACGYRSDPTHKTFVNAEYIQSRQLAQCEGFTMARASYFPLDWSGIGEYFVFHEFKLVYERKP